jgi:hypothetical protein
MLARRNMTNTSSISAFPNPVDQFSALSLLGRRPLLL